jgi:hypothetical protein
MHCGASIADYANTSYHEVGLDIAQNKILTYETIVELRGQIGKILYEESVVVGRGALPRQYRNTGDHSTGKETHSCKQDKPLRLHVNRLDAGSLPMASIA